MASLVSSSPSPNPLLPPSSQPDLPSMPSPSPRSPSPPPPPDPPSNPNPSPSPAPTAEPSTLGRRQRLPRACTNRSRAREAEPPPRPPPPERRRREKTEETGSGSSSRVVTPLVPDPVPADVPLFNLRSMWQLASVLNFLHVFRSLLNIAAEFTSEELESALISPNNILDDIHMPMLKSIPPVTRMGMARGTWVTVLCRKLRDWWHWVGEGEVPIVADHGAEIEAYKILDPATRLMILKAICDIRVEQEDIRNYIDYSIKRGAQLSLFRKDRIGGDSFGISYWYEDDPVLGHRLYREIRKVETPKIEGKKPDTKKRKGRPPPPPPPIVTYQWETVATNLDEFQEVSDKLFASKNRTEVSLAKKLKIDYLPEIEKTHQMNIALIQKKEKLLKKQQREALLLNSYLTADGVTSGRSLRNRKNVTYTFDDYDRSINEAIKLTKRSQESPEPAVGTSSRRTIARHEASANGQPNGQSNGPSFPLDDFHDAASPKSEDNDAETDHEGEPDGPLDRSNRRRKRPQKYSEDFVDAAAYDVNANFDSDDDIVGEVVYDEEYLKTRKNKSASSGSEGDEEYKLDDDEEEEENLEEDEYVEEEEDSIGSSEEELEMSHRSRRYKKESPKSKRGARKLRSVDDIDTGLRRSKRATRPKINYRKYELSESDTNSDADADVAYSENDQEVSTSSQDRNEENGEEMGDDDDYDNNYNNGDNYNNYDNNGGNDVMNEDYTDIVEQEQKQESLDKERSPCEEKEDSLPRRFLDLNDPAPDMGFDDGPNMSVKDEDMDDS